MLRILYGPTASGKSALALNCAVTNKGAIINADSLQLYDALPLLTAQPGPEEQQQAPHKLYGFADPKISMNAAQWAALAASEIAQNDNAVLVGGTGLYVTTLLDGIAPIPDIAPGIRMAMTRLYDELGPEGFHAKLNAVDLDSAARIHPNRSEQMIRAMEVYEGTGLSLSDWHKKPRTKFLPHNTDVRLVVLAPDKTVLHGRAALRFGRMLEENVLEEVEDFGCAFGVDAPATKALGFKPLWAHVTGALTLEEAKDRYLQDTNDYIKRQLTWGRQQLAPRSETILCTTAQEAADALAHR